MGWQSENKEIKSTCTLPRSISSVGAMIACGGVKVGQEPVDRDRGKLPSLPAPGRCGRRTPPFFHFSFSWKSSSEGPDPFP